MHHGQAGRPRLIVSLLAPGLLARYIFLLLFLYLYLYYGRYMRVPASSAVVRLLAFVFCFFALLGGCRCHTATRTVDRRHQLTGAHAALRRKWLRGGLLFASQRPTPTSNFFSSAACPGAAPRLASSRHESLSQAAKACAARVPLPVLSRGWLGPPKTACAHHPMVAAAAGSSGRLFDGRAATLRSAAARRQPRARQRGSVAVARDASGSATDGLARALSAPAWSAGEERRPLVLTFHWIVDDIVSHTGETAMCCPGGGGLQTAFGVRIAGGDCCISARVGGDDFPEAHRQYVDILGASLNLLALPGARLAFRNPSLAGWLSAAHARRGAPTGENMRNPITSICMSILHHHARICSSARSVLHIFYASGWEFTEDVGLCR